MSSQPDFYEDTKQMILLRLGRMLAPEEGGSIASFSMLTEHHLREMLTIGEASTVDAAEFMLFLCAPELRQYAIGFSKSLLEGKLSARSVIDHFEWRRARRETSV
jgi:hypothetical protein